MRNLALKPHQSEPVLEYGTVAAVRDEEAEVRIAHGTLLARRAASCLLAPEAGDRILLSLDGLGQAWVLAVLERGDPEAAARLRIAGPARLEVPAGDLAIAARDGLTLSSAVRLEANAPEISLGAARLEAGIGEASVTGESLDSRFDRIRLVARNVDSFVTRCVARLVSSFRFVREHDETQAASARQLVEGTLTVQTGNTVHTAEGHVKIDAEQIHLG